MQKEVIVEVLLDSRVTGLIISSDFARKMRFKLIYIRNMNRIFNKKRLIEYIVEVNIYY